MKTETLKDMLGFFVALATLGAIWYYYLDKHRWADTTHFKDYTGVNYAMVQVPVPIADALEGHDVTYKINCHLEDGILTCEDLGEL